jgi:tetratricopeptide (TPR) repeat protein
MIGKWMAFLLTVLPIVSTAQNIDLLIFNKKYSEALSSINRELAIQPNADLYFKKGDVYRRMSKPLDAELAIERAISLDSTNSGYLSEFADLQLELGNPFKAIPYYRRASFLAPDDFDIQYRLGRAYIVAENYEKAYETFSLIRYADSTNVVYNKQLAVMAFRLGKIEQSKELFEWVVDKNPVDLTIYHNLVSINTLMKEPVHVIRMADLGLYHFPENPSLTMRKAVALYNLREYKEAIPVFESYLAKSDSTFDVLKNYGISLYFVQEYIKAKEILNKCFLINQADPNLDFYLGLTYAKLADINESNNYLNLAITIIRENMTEMYHSLGQNYNTQREFEKSVDALKEAFKCDPQKIEYLSEIAYTYEQFGKNKKNALDFYERYLELAGDSAPNSKYASTRIMKIKESMNAGKK